MRGNSAEGMGDPTLTASGKLRSTMTSLPFDQSFPLRRIFLRYIMPGLMILLTSCTVLTVLGSRHVAQGVYFDHATRLDKVIKLTISQVPPDA